MEWAEPRMWKAMGSCAQRLGQSCSFLFVSKGRCVNRLSPQGAGGKRVCVIDFLNCGLRLNRDMRTDFDGVLTKFIWLEFGQLDVV